MGVSCRLRRVAAVPLIALAIVAAGSLAARAEDHPPPAKPAASCPRSAFRVVIDVGHTIAVPGALSARGVPEYAFNLQLANDIKRALVDAGFEKTVVLITAAAPPRGLVERALRANAMRADLLLSIHHDSVPDNLLEKWEYEGHASHFSDRFQGYSIFVSRDNGDRTGSLGFGRLLGKELQAHGLGYTPHYTLALMGRHRHELVDAEAGVYWFDQLVVLRRTRIPAVLFEAGSIINRQEEAEMASPERRAQISAAAAAAVEDFCAARSHPLGERPQPVQRRVLPRTAMPPNPFAPTAFTR
jgi:N-acetylmuramoyl-L-alanine amidase